MPPVQKSEFKKSYGAFYTPTQLALELTNRALGEAISSQIQDMFNISLSIEDLVNLRNRKILKSLLSYLLNFSILDGSLGQGQFIITSFDLLYRICSSISEQLTKLGESHTPPLQERILNNLYGMEIDSNTLNACYGILKEKNWGINNKFIQTWMKNNLVEGNFLESNFASWKRIYDEFHGFDLIIGNPPWGSQLTKSEKIHYYKKYNLSGSKRNLNSFELFVYQSTYLLKPKIGYLAFYLPKNITRSNQYINLRKFILHNYQIKSLFFHDLFKEVTQEFISIIAQFTDEDRVTNKVLINNEERILQKVYMNNTDYIFTKITDNTFFHLLNLIKNGTKALEEYVTIQRGEELSKKGGIMYCYSCESWVPLSSRKPRIECPECHEILDKNQILTRFLISPKKTSEHILPILTGDDFDHYYIKSTHYFNDSIKFKSKKKRDVYKSPKIVLQKIKQFPCAAIDYNDTLTTQNVYNIRLKKEWQEKSNFIFYILAILNSRLMNWFYENQFNLGSKYTNAISIKNLKRLPIRPPEENEKIIEAMEKLLTRWPQSDISLDLVKKELDNLVFDLYKCSSFIDLG